MRLRLLIPVLLTCGLALAISGTFRGKLTQAPVVEGNHRWLYLQSPNGSVRRVESSRAQVVYSEDLGRSERPTDPREALKPGAGLRVTASQDDSGEWQATVVEIVELPSNSP